MLYVLIMRDVAVAIAGIGMICSVLITSSLETILWICNF